ncbi:hypothetical protein QE364_004009 [Nocardioides zeae]|uniref:Uncharacterized protein n=1 Tax=Nocardioides zeae TaxID=1457234 RepID=A0ACC6INL2_9ACTN|nr:hypothetical protein [Nocardioides zeae]MDR6173409.1 hypothetical protein [Nocardioides zeae]MDR6212274.1 hypothetical protein [Nocardioides zeae]
MSPHPSSRPRRRSVTASAAAVAAAVLLAGLAGCSGDDEPEEAAPTAAPPPVLTDLDTTALVVERASFCDDVDPAAVAAALGTGEDSEAQAAPYSSGDAVDLGTGEERLVHELGCRWGDGAASPAGAAAWVFVPPVPPADAEEYVAATPTDGCNVLEGPAFGAPTLALACALDGATEVSFRGLFGDAWLTCTLTAPTATTSAEELVERAGAWCAAVAVAAS